MKLHKTVPEKAAEKHVWAVTCSYRGLSTFALFSAGFVPGANITRTDSLNICKRALLPETFAAFLLSKEANRTYAFDTAYHIDRLAMVDE